MPEHARAVARQPRREHHTIRSRKRRFSVPLVAAGLVFALGGTHAFSSSDLEIPPDVDPGTPEYTGAAQPVPDEPVEFDPTISMLDAIHEADVAAGGDSFWFDDILARPAGASGGNALLTRGRALYMYNHNPEILGFGNGWAYRERPGSQLGNATVESLYSIAVSEASFSEDTGQRTQYPSHWTSTHSADALTAEQAKFITHNNVAVTLLTLTNTGDSTTTRTVTASSPLTSTDADSEQEGTGSVDTRYNVTTVTPRFSGDGFSVTGDGDLNRSVTLEPDESITLKVQLGTTTGELPESGDEYERYREYEADTALSTHRAEYNEWWATNVPYVDVPDQNIKKMSYYRTFLNRFNLVDADIPGNDYQFPVSIEGVLGYNNAIQLTQPMHMQDLKYFRDPIYAYGNLLSSGETSKCDAFISNPGSFSWGNTYEQYIAREAWNTYKIHGGDEDLVRNFAYYADCDIQGQLDKYDGQGNYLIEYPHGFLTGNDFDATPFVWAHPNQGNAANRQDRAETAFWYSGARAASEAYALLGDDDKAAEMDGTADNMSEAILELLWDDSEITDPPEHTQVPATRIEGQEGFGNAIGLGGSEPNQYVEMPEGIINDLTDFTIAAWVNWEGGQAWARIFDFGIGTTENMFLTPNATFGDPQGLRFAITNDGSGAEEQISTGEPLPTGWQHVAVTLEDGTGTIWLNGEPAAVNDEMTLTPSDITPNASQNWIGQSQYPDPRLNGAVDEFQIFDRALDGTEIASLLDSPDGDTGGGDVAWYRFDEDGGNDVVDASGSGNDATVATTVDFVGDWPGHVFKHRLVDAPDGVEELIPWKDQQNFAPFIEGIVPTDDESYREALRYYADAEEFPIMPFFTANQRDKAMAEAIGRGGSNNFSNINSTLQAQIFSSALRHYPSEYITPGMYRALLEWLTWVQYADGDNRYPNNNEYFFGWDPEEQTFGRFGIHHNILGAYNFMIFDDVVGIRPRLDDVVELWPIDIGWEYFAVNNVNYHGQDMTVVWNDPDDPHYENAPAGYSLYLDGELVFTLDALAHVEWDSSTGEVSVLDDSGAAVVTSSAAPVAESVQISLAGNDRMADMLQKAGRDISPDTGWAVNHAEGKPVDASFTTSEPSIRATDPAHAVSGFTVSGLPSPGGGNNFNVAGYEATNTIWGTEGSPNEQDWLEIDLEQRRTLDTAKLYFFSDKSYNTQQNCPGDCTNTYREPASYTIQYHDGEGWADVPEQAPVPETPLPNYNEVSFSPVTTDRLRLLVEPQDGFGVGVKEIQAFNTTPVSVGELRALVEELREADEVTTAGAARLHALLIRADRQLDRDRADRAAEILREFTELAVDDRFVVTEPARDALVDGGEQKIAQLTAQN